jgi:hypothetical protein
MGEGGSGQQLLQQHGEWSRPQSAMVMRESSIWHRKHTPPPFFFFCVMLLFSPAVMTVLHSTQRLATFHLPY